MPHDTVIHTLRHAQSTYGAERRYAGSLDVPLSDRGVRDCLDALPAISGVKVDAIVTSTLARSIETARLLGFGPETCTQTPLCNERRYGVLEGRTWREAHEMDPPVLFVQVGDDTHSVNPVGGEPFEDVWQRAREFRTFLFDRYEGMRVLVVAHGVFLQMFHGVLRGSNCIESLAHYPTNLTMTTLTMSDGRLVSETRMRLLETAEKGF